MNSSRKHFVCNFGAHLIRGKVKSYHQFVLDLYDPERDELLNFIRLCQLNNKYEDKVKMVYHADFLSIISPINQQEYDQFVRGCH